jgi:hypothetical protein
MMTPVALITRSSDGRNQPVSSAAAACSMRAPTSSAAPLEGTGAPAPSSRRTAAAPVRSASSVASAPNRSSSARTAGR